MDPNRASSVYSTESSRKPTYLDYQSGLDPTSRAGSFQAARDYAESLGSVPNRQPPSAPAPAPVSTRSRQSSRQSLRPSFMNYQDTRAESNTQSIDVPQPALQAGRPETGIGATARQASGLLLVCVAAAVHPSTVHYLEIALKKHLYSRVALVGSEQHQIAIKQLKMDVYGLAGKLGLGSGVQTHLYPGSSEGEVAAAVQKALNGTSDLQSVLCSLTYDVEETADANILSMEHAELERSWRMSVGFLHSVAQATVPLLQSADGGQSEQASLFLVMESNSHTSLSRINKAACDTLMRQLSTMHKPQELLVDYAENVLVPEPEPAHANGVTSLRTDGFSTQASDLEFSPGESPTKLWNMWALQDEIGG